MKWYVGAILAASLLSLVPMRGSAATYPDGTLVMHDLGPGQTSIYVIKDGKKDGIPNWYTFLHHNWNMSEVKNLSQSDLDSIPNGPIFIDEGMIVAWQKPGGTTYVIENSKKRAIPDMETFNNLGFTWDRLVRLPDDQLNAIPTGAPLPHQVAPTSPSGPICHVQVCSPANVPPIPGVPQPITCTCH